MEMADVGCSSNDGEAQVGEGEGERERERKGERGRENVSKRRQPITQLVTMNETIEPIKMRKSVGHWTSLLVDSKKDLASTRFRCKR